MLLQKIGAAWVGSWLTTFQNKISSVFKVQAVICPKSRKDKQYFNWTVDTRRE